MKRQTIFLNNVTVADFAWVDTLGVPHGESVRLKFEVTGNVEQNSESEQVVCDFSTIKSRLKKVIDDAVEGIDHKLVVPCVLVDDKPSPIVGEVIRKSVRPNSGAKTPFVYTYKNPVFTCELPDDAICFVFPIPVVGEEVNGVNLVKSYLNTTLRNHFPEFSIVTHLDCEFNAPTVDSSYIKSGLKTMTYTHGLPTSTSYGCQNILHGHRSYLQLVSISKRFVNSEYESRVEKLANVMAEHLHGAYVFSSEYAMTKDLCYETNARGKFSLSFYNDSIGSDDDAPLKVKPICIGNGYTTVENLADYLVDTFRSQLKELAIQKVYVSEGLEKGAVVTL